MMTIHNLAKSFLVLFLFGMFSVVLYACSSTAGQQPSIPLVLFTQTVSVDGQMSIKTAYPTFTPVEPSPIPIEDIKDFDLVYSGEPILPGVLTDIYVSGDGTKWLVSDRGAARIVGFDKNITLTRFWDAAVGIDEAGHLWVISNSGARISSWDGYTWSHYDEKSGWYPIIKWNIGNPVADLETLAGGDLWLLTQRDLRKFVNNRWFVYTLDGMGFNDRIRKAIDVKLVFDIVADDEPWVGLCYWMDEKPIGGQGARTFTNGDWINVPNISPESCVSAITIDDRGLVWLGVNGAIAFYDPSRNQTELLVPPSLKSVSNLTYRYVLELPVDELGTAWPLFGLCGEEDCGLFSVRYRLDVAGWHQIDDIFPLSNQKLLFDQSGNAWVFTKNVIYAAAGNNTIPKADVWISGLCQGSNKDIWIIGRYENIDAIWRLQKK